MSINTILAALVEELVEGGMDDPLAEPLTLAALWSDLARIAGEPLPADVAALVDGPRPIRPVLAVPKPTRRVCVIAPCEACGRPVGPDDYRDSEACIALCADCAESDREYACDVARLAR
jgi:hypothetical protein